jgi:hypothetical protein
MMKTEHVQWCRKMFATLNDGAIWGLPACGLVFRRIGDDLVLIERMPHCEGMPMSPEELSKYQDYEYENNRQHFEAAGITVRRMQ